MPVLDLDPEMTLNIVNGSSPYYENWYVNINGYTVGWYPWAASGDSPGYWGTMLTNATYLQAGGEVQSGSETANYTLTAMGSGVYPTSSNYAHAAYLRNLQYFSGSCQEDSGTWYTASPTYITGLPAYEDDVAIPGVCGMYAGYFYNRCGGAAGCAAGGSDWGEYFYFGGTP